MRQRLAGCALTLCGAVTPGLHAQTSDYIDRVLESGAQSESEAPSTGATAAGWPRSFSVELQDWRQSGSPAVSNQTLLLGGYLDTPDYGALSAHFNLNRYHDTFSSPGDSGVFSAAASAGRYRNASTWRIDQRGMPFNDGWLANNSIGDINTASTPLSRGGLGYVYLPTLPVEGVSSVFERAGRSSLNASFGRLGYFDGLDFQGFALTRGNAASLGLQQQIGGDTGPLAAGRSDAALQWLSTRRFDASGQASRLQDTDSFWGALSWQGVAPWAAALGSGLGSLGERPGGLRVQANLAHSASGPSDDSSLAPRDAANGGWLDAAWRTDWLQQRASLFYFQPSLRWGSNPIASDLRGASWRGDVATRQWQLGGNMELSESVSGLSGRSLYGGVFGRYRLDSRDALSATLAARTGNQQAQSLQVNWEHISRWGQTQWYADTAHQPETNLLRLGVDQAWSVGETHTLSTSLAMDRSAQAGSSVSSISYGVLGSLPLAGARLDLSVRGTRRTASTDGSNFLNASARLNWPLAYGWSFIAQYTAARGRESLNPMVMSALTSASQGVPDVIPESRTFLLALRYESRAGSASAPIGGLPGSGAGRIEGHVFFDQNANGTREANEGGTAGVSVVLDQRYMTHTDAQGYYSFPSVAAGSHQIELVPDNLPLPWTALQREAVRVEVRVRETVTLEMAVQRDR